MPTVIEQHRGGIEALCREYGVRRLDAFGSAVRDDFDPDRSDVDFVLEFEPDAGPNRFIRAAIEASRQVVYGA